MQGGQSGIIHRSEFWRSDRQCRQGRVQCQARPSRRAGRDQQAPQRQPGRSIRLGRRAARVRGIDGGNLRAQVRDEYWHQIPLLRAMPDRGLDGLADLESHWIVEVDYFCKTGWPNMSMKLSDDGWMGIAPSGKKVVLRSLDFWRLEGGLIRENWVLIDLLDLYDQIGVDVLGRLLEFNKVRCVDAIRLPDALTL